MSQFTIGSIIMQNQKTREIENHIETFKQLVLDAEDTISRTEFLDAFKQILEGFQALKQSNMKEVEALRGISANEAGKLSEGLNTAMNEALDRIDAATSKSLEEQRVGMNMVNDKVSAIKDGKDADEDRMLEKLSILTTDHLERNKPTVQEMRDSFEALEDDERLNVKSIAGLSTLLQELWDDVNKIKNRPAYVGSPMGIGTNFTELTATGDVDGTNADYVFVSKPQYINVNGSMYREGKGWSWSGSTATLDFNPPTGSDVFGVL